MKATDLGSAQVLKHLNMFLVSDAFGDIVLDGRGMGLYDGDTRILSCSVLRITGERPVVLHSDPGGSWRGVVQATNPEFRKDPGDKMGGDERILRQTISIARERMIAEAYRERLDIENHGPIAFDCHVELELDADYADIFEVRGYSRPARGKLLPIEATADGGLVFGYVGLDGVTVRTHVAFDPAPTLQPTRDDQGGSVVAHWANLLRPGERRQIAWTVHASREPAQSVHPAHPDALDPAQAHASWLSKSSVIETDHELIDQVIRRSLDDLCLLESTDPLGDRFIAAGVPWFSMLFGRDFADHLAPDGLLCAAPGDPVPGNPGQAPSHCRRRLARRGAGQDPARVPDRRDEPDRRTPVRALLRLDRFDAPVAHPARRDARLDRRRRPGRSALAERPGRT